MPVCYSGDPADAGKVLAPIRALGDPVVDLLAEQPYTEVQSYLDDGRAQGCALLLEDRVSRRSCSDGLLSTMRELVAECPIPEAEIGILHLAGALNEHDADDGAVGNRDARYVFGVNGMWDPDEPDADALPHLDPRGVGADPAVLHRRQLHQLPDRRRGRRPRPRRPTAPTSTAWSGSSSAYDPDNLFRVNRNVRLGAQGPAE